MTQRRRRTTKPAPAEAMSGVMPLGSNYNGIPFALDLATGAVEPTAPAGAEGAAQRARLLSFGEVTAAKLVEILCNGGYRARQDDVSVFIGTSIGRLWLWVDEGEELLRFMSLHPLRQEVAETEQQTLSAQLNTDGLIARYYAEDGWITVEYDIPLSCGITGPQLLLATRRLVENVERDFRLHRVRDLMR